MEFGENLRKARENLGITQQTLADQIFVTRQAVSRWECGARFPDLMTAKKLAEILNVSLDDLLSTEETIKCIEETPLIDSPVLLRIQTALYGFFSMTFFSLNIFTMYLIFSDNGNYLQSIFAEYIFRFFYFFEQHEICTSTFFHHAFDVLCTFSCYT